MPSRYDLTADIFIAIFSNDGSIKYILNNTADESEYDKINESIQGLAIADDLPGEQAASNFIDQKYTFTESNSVGIPCAVSEIKEQFGRNTPPRCGL